jgi:hypothetical protein
MCETYKETQQCPVKILYDSTFSILKYGTTDVSPTNSAAILNSIELQWINKFPELKYQHVVAVDKRLFFKYGNNTSSFKTLVVQDVPVRWQSTPV